MHLTAEDRKLLLDIVPQEENDFHDGLMGWPNVSVAENVGPYDHELIVTFTTDEENRADRVTLEGRWGLVFLGGSKKKGQS
jgi:hypothetical protein